jgi:hypothetical protein
MWTRYDGDVEYNQNDVEEISKLLVGRRVEKVSENTLLLDDGTVLEVQGNEGGCSCGGGDYDLTELNSVDNAIMSVEVEERYKSDEERGEDDWYGGSQVYTLFVYAENEKLKLAEFEGDDGSGYYGTGFQITVKKRILG